MVIVMLPLFFMLYSTKCSFLFYFQVLSSDNPKFGHNAAIGDYEDLSLVWIVCLCVCVCNFQRFPLFFFFFFFQPHDFSPLYSAPVYCSRDPQTLLFGNFFIKNGSHGTIHTFKNYFSTVFSVFSFQQNKLYPNGPLIAGVIVEIREPKPMPTGNPMDNSSL